jgi:hypothetical protein
MNTSRIRFSVGYIGRRNRWGIRDTAGGEEETDTGRRDIQNQFVYA